MSTVELEGKVLLIQDFFLGPRLPKRLPKRLRESGHRSLLHLLRRDLEKLYGPENYFGVSKRVRHKAPVLAALGMLVGIDLMSTFSCPDEMRHKVGARFDWFTRKFSTQDQEWKFEFLKELRNALAHRYSMRVRRHGKYRFSTDTDYEDWVVLADGWHIINLWGLKDLFLQVVNRFKTILDSDQILRKRFLERYQTDGGDLKAPPIA